MLAIMAVVICFNLILLPFIGVAAILPILGILLLLAFLFHSLTIHVNNDEITWYFGPGFWKKSIKTDLIKSAKVVQTKWYYGIGIRLIPSGWLYNVSGSWAVQIELKNGKKITLGTNEPKELLKAIESKFSE